MLKTEEVELLAKSSKIEMSTAEIQKAKDYLNHSLAQLESLRALDLTAIRPTIGIEKAPPVLRQDSPKGSFVKAQVFKNAPQVESDHFAIPKVIGG
ncbi:MAG: Asp-tRNA(Asn)/Glu-tRNA(Gln) amidotransferase subunit GatC [Fibrobacter sp.]|jgi:aspartyl-tRNA(Asn)/glutamyl-tRNA(Gln) amidotransferase subunit C|nr:Asp-tRNA(Asn)/Glu-tRNA(Gln) amidotransferase subunit GatC [Fibrobacter sp.]